MYDEALKHSCVLGEGKSTLAVEAGRRLFVDVEDGMYRRGQFLVDMANVLEGTCVPQFVLAFIAALPDTRVVYVVLHRCLLPRLYLWKAETRFGGPGTYYIKVWFGVGFVEVNLLISSPDAGTQECWRHMERILTVSKEKRWAADSV